MRRTATLAGGGAGATGRKKDAGAAEKQVAEMYSQAEESTEVSGERGEVADDTSEVTGTDEVSGVSSGKVGDELGMWGKQVWGKR